MSYPPRTLGPLTASEARTIAEEKTDRSGDPYSVVEDRDGFCFVLTTDQAENLAEHGQGYTLRFQCWITFQGRRTLVGQLMEDS